MIFSASGLAIIIAAPSLGKLSDKIGAHKVILAALIVSGILFIPQAFVRDPWQLMGLRFLLGFATAGLVPSINALPFNFVGSAPHFMSVEFNLFRIQKEHLIYHEVLDFTR